MTDFLKALPWPHWLGYAGDDGPRLVPAGEEFLPCPPGVDGYVLLVRSGEAEILWREEEGDTSHVAVVGPGDVLWTDLGIPRDRDRFVVRASRETEVLMLSEKSYFRLHADHPDVGHLLTGAFTRRVRTANAFLADALRKRSLRELALAETSSYWDVRPVAASKETRALLARFRELAGAPGPVLIEGEFGTGKRLAAVRIHLEGARSPKAFVMLDCGTLTAEDWEERLFGRPASADRPERSFGAVELAEGGTLYLRHCDQMPPPAQGAIREMLVSGTRRGRPGRPHRLLCRIVVSARTDLAEATAKGLFDRELHALLAPNSVLLPPLRDRKRDIPLLVEHFVRKFASQGGVTIDEVTPEAMKSLINHDYRLANVKELSQIIERAVPLSRDGRIWSRHLFLGAPAQPLEGWRLDLLRLPFFRRWVKAGLFPARAAAVTAVLFVAIVATGLIGAPAPLANLGARLVWGLWWPLLFLSLFLFGRVWCSVCAYAAFGRLARRIGSLDLRPPDFLRERGPLVAAAGLLLIFWVEEITGMRQSPRLTGVLMLSLLGLAVLSAVLFQRESWCRHLCPLGGMVGVASMGSMLEVRADTEVCLNQCKKSECYLGTPGIPGCPMFEHLGFLDTNQTCKMCLNCVRNCSYDSVSVNLRLPGSEIWLFNRKHDLMSLFVPVLLGTVVPPLFLESCGLSLEAAGAGLVFTTGMLLAPLAAGGLLWLPNLFSRRGDGAGWTRFWMTSYAWVPVAVAAHAAFRLRDALGADSLRYSVELAGAEVIRGSLVQPLRIAAVATGALFSLFCLARVRKRRQGTDFDAGAGFWYGQATLMVAYAALLIGLLAR